MVEEGAFNGFGTYYFDNGARYVGNFVNDTYVGKYMNIYEDGSEGYMNGEQLNLK